MSSTVNRISPVSAELEITISTTDIEEAAMKRFQQISRQARISGFRRGKVPMGVVRRMFSSSVYTELTREMMISAFVTAMQENDIKPLGEPDFRDVDKLIVPGQDFVFRVGVENAPGLDAVVTDGIELKKTMVQVDSDVVDSEIRRLQKQMATTQDLQTPRPVAPGDMVSIEMKRIQPDGTVSDAALPPQEFPLEKDSCPEPLMEALPGKTIGDVVEVELGPEADRVRFQCVLKTVKERTLPVLDDDFARDLGEFDTMVALRESIEKRYLESMAERQKESLKQDLFAALRDKNPMALPPAILERQTRMMKDQQGHIMEEIAKMELKKKGESPEETNGDPDNESMTDAMNRTSEEAAQRIVHTHFLLEEIARHHDLTVKPADLDVHFSRMAEATGIPLPRIKAEYGKPEHMGELEGRILEDKVFDFMLPKVTITEVASMTEASAEEA